MKPRSRETLASRVMNEKVNFGGEFLSRAQVYRRLCQWDDDQAQCCADYFAFATPAVCDDEQASFGAACACGARWLGPEQELESCPSCEE